MKKDYKKWHDSVSAGFVGKEKTVNYLNNALTYSAYVGYPLILAWFWLTKRPPICEMAKLVLIPAVSFRILTAVRDKIDRPRPYETHDITQIIKKDKKGHSFPSRHCFSMACVSMVFMYVNRGLGRLFVLFTAVLAALRVIGGVHYPSDVAAGCAVGFLCGALIFIM